MSLREEAITHMAAKVCVEPTTCLPHLEEATMSLTALLDFLDAHTEEWEKESGAGHKGSGQDRHYIIPHIPDLVAALRGTTEEPQ